MGVEVAPHEAKSKAEAYFREGLPCTQSLLLALQELLEVDDPTTLKAAAALGRGLGGTGLLCGVLAAGMMAIGLQQSKHGREPPPGTNAPPLPQHDWLDFYLPGEGNYRMFFLCRQFYLGMADELLPRFGSLNCRDISGVDWNSPMEIARYYAPDGSFQTCAKLVGKAAEVLATLMKE